MQPMQQAQQASTTPVRGPLLSPALKQALTPPEAKAMLSAVELAMQDAVQPVPMAGQWSWWPMACPALVLVNTVRHANN